MTLLNTDVDTSTIARWAHASTRSTDVYLHADLALQERALTRTPRQSITARKRRTG
jgi:integrase/recombinase XerD